MGEKGMAVHEPDLKTRPLSGRLFCPVPPVSFSFTPYLLSDGSFDMSFPFTAEKAAALVNFSKTKAESTKC